ncbi:hypothetical protein GCM10027564_27990 [Luteimonas notoginsengisoli]
MDRVSRLVVGVVAAAIASSCTNDVLDSSYATRAEAIAAGAVKRGWIPAWVPAEATELLEVHKVDTSESALLFSLPSGLHWKPPAPCRPADAGEFSEPAFSRSWLPDTESGYTFYSCPSGVNGSVPIIAAVAVRQDGQRVLHWRVFAR